MSDDCVADSAGAGGSTGATATFGLDFFRNFMIDVVEVVRSMSLLWRCYF